MHPPSSLETSQKPLYFLRERHKELELSHPLRFQTHTDRLFSPRSSSPEHRHVSPAQRYGKTLVSLELGLHTWQEGEI